MARPSGEREGLPVAGAAAVAVRQRLGVCHAGACYGPERDERLQSKRVVCNSTAITGRMQLASEITRNVAQIDRNSQ